MPLTHSSSDTETLTVFSIVQIPMINFAKKTTSLTLHPDLDLIILNKVKNSYRFLSDREFAECLEVSGRKVCQKQEIEIYPVQDCNLAKADLQCNDCSNLVFHDLKNTEILVHFSEGKQVASLDCEGLTPKEISLPQSGIIIIGSNCTVRHKRFTIRGIRYDLFVKTLVKNAHINFA